MDERPELVAYVNGRLVPYSQAAADMTEAQAESNLGLYDAERTFGGQVFKLRQHLQRLYRSLDLAQLDPGLSLDSMERSTLQVLDANRHMLQQGEDFVIGQMVTRRAKSGSNGKGSVSIVVYCQFIDFSAFANSYVRGIRVVTPITYAVPPAQPDAGADGAAQETYSLMTDDKGNVTECSHANFLFVKDGRIKLPNRENVLPGISMETVLELAESLGTPVDEGDYCAHDVYEAEEAFVSGTRYCMLPVATLNGLKLGQEVPGPLTRALMAAWSERVSIDFVEQARRSLPDVQAGAPLDGG